jgi:hypothetical protein
MKKLLSMYLSILAISCLPLEAVLAQSKVSNSPNQSYNVTSFGAQCAGVQVTDGVSALGSPTIASASGRFTSRMVGWVAVVNFAAAGGRQLVTTVKAYNSATSITLLANAGASSSRETVSLYPDDTDALIKAFGAAAAAKVSIILPAGRICGFANPGSNVNRGLSFPALYLNGGQLWLGQTGPTTDTGVSLEPTSDGFKIVGPGVIDGLYQTDQGIVQANAAALEFQNGAGTINGVQIVGNVVIQNTKGRAFSVIRPNNLHISDLTVRNCGDYKYVPPSGDEEIGRSMCGQVDGASGNLTISNYTSINAAQSGLLISNSTDPHFHAVLNNLHFFGNAYYGLDVEEIAGTVEVNKIENRQTEAGGSRSFVFGGSIFLDTRNIEYGNFTHTNMNGNGLVVETQPGGKAQIASWNIANGTVSGTSVAHNGGIYIAWQNVGNPERIRLAHIHYDTINFAPYSAPACTASNPFLDALILEDIHASGLARSKATSFAPDGNPNELIYVKVTDSSLGSIDIASAGANKKELFFDLANVSITGPGSFFGGHMAGIVSGSAGIRNPQGSFTCP